MLHSRTMTGPQGAQGLVGAAGRVGGIGRTGATGPPGAPSDVVAALQVAIADLAARVAVLEARA
jgi:hypothetical protein